MQFNKTTSAIENAVTTKFGLNVINTAAEKTNGGME